MLPRWLFKYSSDVLSSRTAWSSTSVCRPTARITAILARCAASRASIFRMWRVVSSRSAWMGLIRSPRDGNHSLYGAITARLPIWLLRFLGGLATPDAHNREIIAGSRKRHSGSSSSGSLFLTLPTALLTGRLTSTSSFAGVAEAMYLKDPAGQLAGFFVAISVTEPIGSLTWIVVQPRRL